MFDERLREFDFGTWEGVRWDAIPRAELDAWAADFFHARPHGGESVHMLRERVETAIADDGLRVRGCLSDEEPARMQGVASAALFGS